MTDTKGGMRI